MKNNINSKIIIISICVSFLVGGILGCIIDRFIIKFVNDSQLLKTKSTTQTGVSQSSNSSDTQQYPDARQIFDDDIKFNYIDTSEFVNCLTKGVYRCGTDFSEGDYYILSLFGANANYDISNDTNNFSFEKRIIRKLHISQGQYVKLERALLIPENDIDLNNSYQKYGIYKVGEGIQEGEYKVTPIEHSYQNSQYNINVNGNLAAYQITEGTPVGRIIDCQIVTDEQVYLTLHKGDVLMINNVALKRIED